MTFEEWKSRACLPAEADDEEVTRALRICWDEAYRHGANHVWTIISRDPALLCQCINHVVAQGELIP